MKQIFLSLIIGISLYVILMIPFITYVYFGFGICYNTPVIIILGFSSGFITTLFIVPYILKRQERIKKNWITVFTGHIKNKSNDGKMILQVNNAKNKFRVLLYAGGVSIQIPLWKLIETFPEIVPILDRENINYWEHL